MNFDKKTGRILIEGLHNARDLGGMTAKDGKVTAYHRLIRSDALDHLSDTAVTELSSYPVGAVIDLDGTMPHARIVTGIIGSDP